MEELRDKNGLTYEEFMASYTDKAYKKPSVTADIIILEKKNDGYRLLLIKRGGHPFIGKWAFPGGFSNEGETILETAKRELYEETLIKDVPLEEVCVMSQPGRDPRTWVIDVPYVAVIDKEIEATASDDAANAKYFDLSYFLDKDILTIHLSNGDIQLKATLKATINKGIVKDYYTFKQIESDMAFDHAESLALALSKINLI